MPKPSPLVCQFLEKISRTALERYQDIIRNYVRRRHGVYALYRRDRLYYVGLARNLRNRLRHHLKDRHGESWDRFSIYLTIGDSHIRELESLLLRIVQPPGNKLKGKFAKAENLRATLARAIRKKQVFELDDLLGSKVRKVIEREEASLNGRVPVLARYSVRGRKLRAKFKDRIVRARVLRNGVITFGGKHFNSPSLAAASACGRRTCNGWKFWQYERAPGDWVRLSELKR